MVQVRQFINLPICQFVNSRICQFLNQPCCQSDVYGDHAFSSKNNLEIIDSSTTLIVMHAVVLFAKTVWIGCARWSGFMSAATCFTTATFKRSRPSLQNSCSTHLQRMPGITKQDSSTLLSKNAVSQQQERLRHDSRHQHGHNKWLWIRNRKSHPSREAASKSNHLCNSPWSTTLLALRWHIYSMATLPTFHCNLFFSKWRSIVPFLCSFAWSVSAFCTRPRWHQSGTILARSGPLCYFARVALWITARLTKVILLWSNKRFLRAFAAVHTRRL